MRPLQTIAQRAGVIVAIALAAALPMFAFSHGVAYNDSVADLHIDPVGYLRQILYAWTPKYFLGMHTGFMQGYLTPYSFAYAVLALARVPPDIAQGVVMFAIYACIVGSTYVSLRYIAPHMRPLGRFTAGVAACWNIYVAFNSHGSSVMLLPYAAMPAFVAVYAAYIDGKTPLFRATAIIVLLSLVAGGVNPPLLAIDAAVVVFFIAAAIVTSLQPLVVLRRAAVLSAIAAAAALVTNLYWIVPFVDFFHSVWLGGVLSESTAMHNAATSFANTLRGFGQWAIFQGDETGPYYAWAPSYEGITVFSLATWATVLLALCSLPFRSARGRSRVFFLLSLICALPLVVGYYSGPLGRALTAPLYDVLFTKVPYFQIFRSVYKWESVVVFSLACLLGDLAGALIQRSTAERSTDRARRAACVVPLLVVMIAFLPVLMEGMNPTQLPLPPWVPAERTQLPPNVNFRAALMPSQYLEQFYWGDPTYYIEAAISARPLVFGYLGSAPYEDSDQWLRRAYSEARSGDPDAAQVFRALSVSRLLSRDDFRSFQDFAFPDETVLTSASLAHDILTRTMRARPVGRNGANIVYALPQAAPLTRFVDHAIVTGAPADVVATSFDVRRLNDAVLIDPSRLSLADLSYVLRSGAVSEVQGGPVGLAATSLFASYPHAYARNADAALALSNAGSYRIFIHRLQTRHTELVISLDGASARPCFLTSGDWFNCGAGTLSAGAHTVAALENSPVGIDVLAVPDNAWRARLAAVRTILGQVAGRVRVRTDLEQHSPVLRSSARTQTITLPPSRPLAGMSLAGTKTTGRDLLVLPDAGVRASSPFRMPENVYALPETYRFNRGTVQQWWVMGNDAHFHVYGAGTRPASVRINVPLCIVGTARRIEVWVNGRQHTDVPLPAHAVHAAGSLTTLVCPPTVISTSVTLTPGVNEVAIRFDGAPVSLQPSPELPVRSVRAAAVMPALPDVHGYQLPPYTLTNLDHAAIANVPLPSERLWGDPVVSGTMGPARRGQRRFIALHVVQGGTVRIAVKEVAAPTGAFSQPLAAMLPNSWSDLDARVIGMWVITTGAKNPRASSGWVFRYSYTMRTFAPIAHLRFATRGEMKSIIVHVAPGKRALNIGVSSPILSDRALHRLEVRSSASIAPALALQYFKQKRWHLVGSTQRVTPQRTPGGRWLIDVSADAGISLSDVQEGKVGVEACGTPLAWGIRLDRAHFSSNIDPGSGRVSSLTVLPCRARRVVLVDGRSDDSDPAIFSLAAGIREASGFPMRLAIRPSTTQTRPESATIFQPAVLQSSDMDAPLPNVPVHQPAATVQVSRLSPVSVDVRANHSVRGNFTLVFGESYHALWQATLNGQQLRHVEVNGFANGWIVPGIRAGQHITLQFTGQRRFMAAAVIALLGLCIVLALAAWEWRAGMSYE